MVSSGNPFVGAVQSDPRDGAARYLHKIDWTHAASILRIEDEEAREFELV